MTRHLPRIIEVVSVPLVYAIYPIAFLAAHNVDEIVLPAAARSLAVAAIAVPALVFLVWAIVGDGYRAALIALAAVVLFFSYGHLREIMKSSELIAPVLGRHRYLAVLFAAAFFGWSGWVARRKESPRIWTRRLGLIGLALLLVPALTLGAASLRRAGTIRAADSELPPAADSGERPDVYYIILDGYGRQDVLKDLYGFDNSEFLAALRDRGFTVADRSLTNYNTTRHSLASSLNLDYLQSLAVADGLDLNDATLEAMIWDSAVRRRLENLGYETVAFESGRPWSSIDTVDHYLEPGEGDAVNAWMPRTTVLNEFETLLVESTFLSLLADSTEIVGALERTQSALANEEHRVRVVYGLQKIGEVARWDGATFTFLHVLSPHPPFVFGPSGERIDHDRPFTFGDGNHFLEIGTRSDYIEGYVQQVQYINTLTLEAVDRLLAESAAPPIIVLQGDHGPGAYLDWGSMEDSDLRERQAILNAYYLPGEGAQALYPDITPVNTFRVIFHSYFGADLETLPDRAFFTEKNGAYELVEITAEVN